MKTKLFTAIMMSILLLTFSCNDKTVDPETQTVAEPYFNPPEGSYVGVQEVEILCDTEGATIKYTIDGQQPTLSSEVYSSPIAVRDALTLKAKAFKEGWLSSPVSSAVYSLEKNLLLEQTYPIVGTSMDIYVTDDYLFLAEDQGGFSIFNRQTGELISRNNTYGQVHYESVRQICYTDETKMLHVYERYGRPSVHFWSIEDVNNPVFVDAFTGDGIRNINYLRTERDVSGKIHLLISMTSGSLRVGEVTPPDHLYPNFLIYDEYDMPNIVNDFDKQGNLVYLAGSQRGMYIFDLNLRTVISETNLPGDAVDVKVQGNYAYVATMEEGLHVVDITDRYSPTLVFSLRTAGNAQAVAVEGDYLAVAAGDAGCYFFDISNNAAEPYLLQRISSEEADSVNLVDISNGELFIAGKHKAVYKYRINR